VYEKEIDYEPVAAKIDTLAPYSSKIKNPKQAFEEQDLLRKISIDESKNSNT
jgi:hypothetical protein